MIMVVIMVTVVVVVVVVATTSVIVLHGNSSLSRVFEFQSATSGRNHVNLRA